MANTGCCNCLISPCLLKYYINNYDIFSFICEGVTIGWEHESYIVGEADGKLDVFVTLSGIFDAALPSTAILVEERTAIRGQGMLNGEW